MIVILDQASILANPNDKSKWTSMEFDGNLTHPEYKSSIKTATGGVSIDNSVRNKIYTVTSNGVIMNDQSFELEMIMASVTDIAKLRAMDLNNVWIMFDYGWCTLYYRGAMTINEALAVASIQHERIALLTFNVSEYFITEQEWEHIFWLGSFYQDCPMDVWNSDVHKFTMSSINPYRDISPLLYDNPGIDIVSTVNRLTTTKNLPPAYWNSSEYSNRMYPLIEYYGRLLQYGISYNSTIQFMPYLSKVFAYESNAIMDLSDSFYRLMQKGCVAYITTDNKLYFTSLELYNASSNKPSVAKVTRAKITKALQWLFDTYSQHDIWVMLASENLITYGQKTVPKATTPGVLDFTKLLKTYNTEIEEFDTLPYGTNYRLVSENTGGYW